MNNLAKRFRDNPTLSERVASAILCQRLVGVEFSPQFPVKNYVLDFYCSDLRLALELDGAFHVFRKRRDQQRDEVLQRLGIKVLRFSSSMVVSNTGGFLDRIRLEVKRRFRELDQLAQKETSLSRSLLRKIEKVRTKGFGRDTRIFDPYLRELDPFANEEKLEPGALAGTDKLTVKDSDLGEPGRRWSSEDESRLKSMWEQGMKPSDIANELSRSRGGITSRLRRLGLESGLSAQSGPREKGTLEDQAKAIIDQAMRDFSPKVQAEVLPANINRLLEVRKRHPRAYLPWDDKEAEKLKEAFRRGEKVRQIAANFQRQPSAIVSRLVKLGLLQPEEGTDF